MWPPPKPPMCPRPPPCPPPQPPRAWAWVTRRLPASTALAKTIITRPLMTFSFWNGRGFPPQDLVRPWRAPKANATVAMDWRWECVFVLSTKFRFTHRHSRSGSNKVSVPNQYLEIKTEWSAPVHLFRWDQERARPASRDHIQRVGRTNIGLRSWPHRRAG